IYGHRATRRQVEMVLTPSRREAIEHAVEQLLYSPCAQLRHPAFNRCLSIQFRMRRDQPLTGIVPVVPDVLGGGNYARQPLRALTFGWRQTRSTLISRLGNHLSHQLVSISPRALHALRRAAQSLFRQPPRRRFRQVVDGSNPGPEHQQTPHHLGYASSFNHGFTSLVSVYPYIYAN